MRWVYELSRQDTGEIFYCGQTADIERRLREHKQPTPRYPSDIEKRKILEETQIVLTKIFSSDSAEEVDFFEKEWTLALIRSGKKLINGTIGRGLPISAEKRRAEPTPRRVEARKNLVAYNKRKRKVFYDQNGREYCGVKETARALGMKSNSTLRQALSQNTAQTPFRCHAYGYYFTYNKPEAGAVCN